MSAKVMERSLQAESQLCQPQLCKKGSGLPGGREVDYEPALCPLSAASRSREVILILY